MNFLIYSALISFIIFYCYMFFKKEVQIKKKRQRAWDNLKQVFDMDDTDKMKLYTLYCQSVPRHWFLGFIFPTF